jgi:hypothetical protein
MGLSDEELRKLLPSNKALDEYVLENETADERLLINLQYATKKFSDLTGSNYQFRHNHYTKAVKWSSRNFINYFKKKIEEELRLIIEKEVREKIEKELKDKK